MKRVAKSIFHSALLIGSITGIIFTGSIPLSILLVPTAIISSARLSDDIIGNEINDSIYFYLVNRLLNKWFYIFSIKWW